MAGNNIDTIFRDLLAGQTILTGAAADISLKPITVHILEMEDVLFHLNSAVMMPDNPAGKSSTQGGGATPAQEKYSGIQALAIVFKQFEVDDKKRLLITAHTDTSGDPDFNFKLSDLRAQNVLYLLDGSRESWAQVSADRHKIENYQQIMIYLVMKKSWDCDPGGITDKWDDKTHEATNKFIANYNDWLLKQKPPPKDAAILDPELSGQIKKDSKHRWPIEMWRAVFDLYTEALVNALNSDSELFEKDYRPLLKFTIDNGREYKYVACGESFPIDKGQKSNYRSQSNRRVEFLFFDEKEVPHFDCPDRVKTVHTVGECPIWNKLHYTPVYINPDDLKLEQIDIAFTAKDIKNENTLYIPEGLKIKVTEDGSTEIHGRVTYSRSFYSIKIRQNPARKSLDSSFETTNQWVDCSDSSNPKIVTKTPDEMATMHFDERAKYYDLPQRWHSKNWRVERGGNWVEFSDTIMNRSGGVINVNLDSTVLVNESLNPETVTSTDRFSIFRHKMIIIDEDPDKTYLTKGTTNKNLFDDVLKGWRPRLFAWNSKFYDCTIKRLYTGDYIGIRAAVKCDPDDHSTASIVEPVVSGAGNFDLHYLKDCLDPDGKGIDALLVHWVCKFTLDTGVGVNEVANFDNQGFSNAIKRWQAKKYHFVPDTDPQNRKLVVWPFFFFEHRDGNPHKCDVTLHADGGRSDMGITKGNFKTPDYCGHGTAIPEDSVSYSRFTMAHEIGHAMGLDDEYRESIEDDNNQRITWWNPPLPRFEQWYPGMPYCIDDRAMMVSNKAPRLRHFWYWCRWVNETTDVKRLTGNSVFHVENGLGKSYKFFIKDEMNNIYKSVAMEENKHNGSSGIFDLYLYKCGADETTDLMITGKSDFDSTLVVRIKLQWFFDDYRGATWASIDSKLDHLRQFQNRIDGRLNGKFYMESADADFKKVYIQFVPHYYFEGTNIHDHFEISVKANNTGSARYQPDFNGDNFTSDEFAVDQIQDEITIMRYMLGLAPYQSSNTAAGVTKTAITTINATDLQFVADWVSSKRGGAAFTVKT